MQSPKLARDIMVTELVTLDPEMDLFDAIDLLLKHQISGAPVVDTDGRFLGVFTEKDCLSILVNAAYEQLPSTQILAFVQTECMTIDDDTDLLTIAQIFLNTPFRRLPVLKDGEVIGQISRRDVLKAVNAGQHIREENGARLLYLSSLIAIEDSPIA